jgi:hypothetical protein
MHLPSVLALGSTLVLSFASSIGPDQLDALSAIAEVTSGEILAIDSTKPESGWKVDVSSAFTRLLC